MVLGFDNEEEFDLGAIDLNYEKPACKLIGEDGNVFNVIGLVMKTLKNAARSIKEENPERAEEFKNQAEEFAKKAYASESYNAVLGLCTEYVELY
jgi:hypothetical protein